MLPSNEETTVQASLKGERIATIVGQSQHPKVSFSATTTIYHQNLPIIERPPPASAISMQGTTQSDEHHSLLRGHENTIRVKSADSRDNEYYLCTLNKVNPSYDQLATVRHSYDEIIPRYNMDHRKGSKTTSTTANDVLPRLCHSWSPSSQRNIHDDIHERLYEQSKHKQHEGMEKRRAIALKIMARHWIPGPEVFGKIPLSRAGDMYDRCMLYLEEKNVRLQTKKDNKVSGSDLLSSGPNETFKPSTSSAALRLSYHQFIPGSDGMRIKNSKRALVCSSRPMKKILPSSRASDMYDRGMSYLQAKHSRIQQSRKKHDSEKDIASSRKIPQTGGPFQLSSYNGKRRTIAEDTSESSLLASSSSIQNANVAAKKIPKSKAGDVYHRGMKRIQDKQLRLESKKELLSGNLAPPPSRLCHAKATAAYDRGMNFLQAKATKLERKRHCHLNLKVQPRRSSLSDSSCTLGNKEIAYSKKKCHSPDRRDNGNNTSSKGIRCSNIQNPKDKQMGVSVEDDIPCNNSADSDLGILRVNSAESCFSLYSNQETWNRRIETLNENPPRPDPVTSNATTLIGVSFHNSQCKEYSRASRPSHSHNSVSSAFNITTDDADDTVPSKNEQEFLKSETDVHEWLCLV